MIMTPPRTSVSVKPVFGVSTSEENFAYNLLSASKAVEAGMMTKFDKNGCQYLYSSETNVIAVVKGIGKSLCILNVRTIKV